MKLDQLGEGGLIRKIRARFKAAVVVPIGDDAAVFDCRANESLVFCSDLLVENRHFVRDIHPPDAIAYKSIAANVSDVGAMGGTPLHFLISLAAPGNLDMTWIDGFLDGVARACEDFDVSLLGGDSSSSDEIFVDVSMKDFNIDQNARRAYVEKFLGYDGGNAADRLLDRIEQRLGVRDEAPVL